MNVKKPSVINRWFFNILVSKVYLRNRLLFNNSWWISEENCEEDNN